MRLVTLSQLSLAGSSGIAEAKIPLWFADGTSVAYSANATPNSALLGDGNNTGVGPSSTAAKLFTLSSSWSSTIKCALEATISTTSSSIAANAELWDITGTSGVSTSQVSTTSTTATVVRSTQFMLTPSHTYGVTFWPSTTGTNAQVVDASLIIFP